MSSRLALAVLCLATLLRSAAALPVDGRRLHVVDGRLVDHRDREITLRGMNARVRGVFDVSFSDGRLPLEDIPVFDAGDAEGMRAFGWNLLRLPINWSAIEPQRGQFATAYLDAVAAVVDLCASRGILVLLDFHQDGFSKEIGQDGAPRWVLDLLLGPNGYPFVGGPLTDLDARRFAPHTLSAFRKFFDDEQGVQALFAETVATVARRFKRSRAVAGYEIMNEPLVLNADGERKLHDFHVRVAKAIRKVDRRHLVVFEPNVTRNIANQAPIPAGRFPDRRAVYAPHVYTYVFDGKTFTGDASALVASMEAAATEATAWGAPLLIGEYGIDPGHPLANRWITTSLDLQDRLRAHSTFWLWEEISEGRWGLFDGESSEPGGERVERTMALSRTFARAVPGRVLEHTFDATANTLRLRFRARGSAPLEIVVPPRRYPGGFGLRCDGAPVDATPDAGVVTFRCGRGRGEHTVELAPTS